MWMCVCVCVCVCVYAPVVEDILTKDDAVYTLHLCYICKTLLHFSVMYLITGCSGTCTTHCMIYSVRTGC